MRPDDNGCSVLNATNYAWLKDYMEPIREHFESDRARDATRTELWEFKHENQRLKQLVAKLFHIDRSDTSFLNRVLPS
ncbi:hypothetical protein ACFLUF_03095 [Chloroflexota bacterium]